MNTSPYARSGPCLMPGCAFIAHNTYQAEEHFLNVHARYGRDNYIAARRGWARAVAQVSADPAKAAQAQQFFGRMVAPSTPVASKQRPFSIERRPNDPRRWARFVV